jgi:hypothetical protein
MGKRKQKVAAGGEDKIRAPKKKMKVLLADNRRILRKAET